MGPNLTKIYLLLRNSGLSEAERNELLGYCAFAGDASLASFARILAEKKSRAMPILQGIRAKRQAFVTKDGVAWKRIVDQELRDLDAYQAA